MTIRALIYGLLVLWSLFAALSYALPTDHVFHFLNAMAVAAGIMTIASYMPAVADAWRNRRSGITAGHVLAFGVVANWIGFTIRLGRWFVESKEPVAGGVEAWAYNVGLWVSITAAALLVSALALSEPVWSAKKTQLHILAFAIVACVLWYIEHAT